MKGTNFRNATINFCDGEKVEGIIKEFVGDNINILVNNEEKTFFIKDSTIKNILLN